MSSVAGKGISMPVKGLRITHMSRVKVIKSWEPKVRGPRKAVVVVFLCKGTLKIDPIMKVLCVTWPVNLIKCHYHQSKYVYGGRNACRPGRICLLVLLSNFGECALTRQGQSLTRMSTAGKAVKERNCTQMPVTKKERTDHKCCLLYTSDAADMAVV